MKNIKYIIILFFQFSLLQLTVGQSAGENGRPVGTSPQSPEEKPTATTSVDVPNSGTYYVDQDIPDNSNAGEASTKEDTYYPIDLEITREELRASTPPAEMAQKINDLNNLVQDLLRVTEELRLENKVMRESLSNCCSSSAIGLTANDAYLLQNTPNPFNESAEIRYFVPEGLDDVELRISNFKGVELNSIKISKAGYGSIKVDSETLENGTFVYSLFVKGKIIDSKVMIKTQ